MSLVLGSGSPRRAALLRELGVAFAVRVSDVPEVPCAGEEAADFARRAAREKGCAVAGDCDGAWVLAADTVVVVDGEILGKPVDAADARGMLARLSGRAHEVLTAVALIAPGGEPAEELLMRSAVEFRDLGADEIDAYIATGEPFDKAGAYGIQGGAALFVHDRAPLRGREAPPRGPPSARRPRQHGGCHRAQSSRHQDGGLDHRPGT
jgi:septum formation protein